MGKRDLDAIVATIQSGYFNTFSAAFSIMGLEAFEAAATPKTHKDAPLITQIIKGQKQMLASMAIFFLATCTNYGTC